MINSGRNVRLGCQLLSSSVFPFWHACCPRLNDNPGFDFANSGLLEQQIEVNTADTSVICCYSLTHFIFEAPKMQGHCKESPEPKL